MSVFISAGDGLIVALSSVSGRIGLMDPGVKQARTGRDAVCAVGFIPARMLVKSIPVPRRYINDPDAFCL